MAASLNKLLTMGLLLCAGTPVLALEPLPDPTKPAVEIPFEAETGKAAEPAAAPAPKKEGLQSVIISPQRRAAIINGEMIVLGGKIGDATLVEVNQSNVVLQGTQGSRVMELFPGVHISKATEKIKAIDNSLAKKNTQAVKPEAGNKNKKTAVPVHTERD